MADNVIYVDAIPKRLVHTQNRTQSNNCSNSADTRSNNADEAAMHVSSSAPAHASARDVSEIDAWTDTLSSTFKNARGLCALTHLGAKGCAKLLGDIVTAQAPHVLTAPQRRTLARYVVRASEPAAPDVPNAAPREPGVDVTGTTATEGTAVVADGRLVKILPSSASLEQLRTATSGSAIAYSLGIMDRRQSAEVVSESKRARARFIGATGFHGDPFDLSAVRACFQSLVDRKTSSLQLARAWSAYLTANYLHVGSGVAPIAYDPVDEDHHVDDFVQNAWVASSGQKLIVCEGFAALAHRILGSLKRSGQPVFRIESLKQFAAGSHIVAVAHDLGGGATIVTNNNKAMLFDHRRSNSFIAQHLWDDHGASGHARPVGPPIVAWFGVGNDARHAEDEVFSPGENMRLSLDARVVRDNGPARRADLADRAAFGIWLAMNNLGLEYSRTWENVRAGR